MTPQINNFQQQTPQNAKRQTFTVEPSLNSPQSTNTQLQQLQAQQTYTNLILQNQDQPDSSMLQNFAPNGQQQQFQHLLTVTDPNESVSGLSCTNSESFSQQQQHMAASLDNNQISAGQMKSQQNPLPQTQIVYVPLQMHAPQQSVLHTQPSFASIAATSNASQSTSQQQYPYLPLQMQQAPASQQQSMAFNAENNLDIDTAARMYLGGTSIDANQVSQSVVNRNTLLVSQAHPSTSRSSTQLADSNGNRQLFQVINSQLRDKLTLVKSLNPATNKSSTPKIAMLRHQLGISSSNSSTNVSGGESLETSDTASANALDALDKWVELLAELEKEIKGLSQAYQDKEKAGQVIMAQMSQNQHTAVRNAHLEVSDLVNEQVKEQVQVREAELRQQIQADFDERRAQERAELEESSRKEVEDCRAQLAEELERVKARVQSEFEAQIEHIHAQNSRKIEQLQSERAQDAHEVEERVTQTLQAQFLQEFSQVQEKTLEDHKHQMDQLKEQLAGAQHEALQQSRVMQEQHKYEERLQLIKKLHEEEMSQVRRVNAEREEHLQKRVIEFEKQKDELFVKAKEQAAKEEKKKREKFQLKVERIKRQEINEMRKQIQADVTSQMQFQLSQQQAFSNKHQQEQMQMILATDQTGPNQSFYPSVNLNNSQMLLDDILSTSNNGMQNNHQHHPPHQNNPPLSSHTQQQQNQAVENSTRVFAQSRGSRAAAAITTNTNSSSFIQQQPRSLSQSHMILNPIGNSQRQQQHQPHQLLQGGAAAGGQPPQQERAVSRLQRMKQSMMLRSGLQRSATRGQSQQSREASQTDQTSNKASLLILPSSSNGFPNHLNNANNTSIHNLLQLSASFQQSNNFAVAAVNSSNGLLHQISNTPELPKAQQEIIQKSPRCHVLPQKNNIGANNQNGSGLTKVESSFSFDVLKREELKTLISVHTQCDDQLAQNDKSANGKVFFFEPFDMRKCLRCGLNDKTASQCTFHPSMPRFAGGAGNLIYSQEWHYCRENCAKTQNNTMKGDIQQQGCLQQSKHFYGVHLPYEPGPASAKRSPSPACTGAQQIIQKKEKETMTEISLMFNPFKSELKEYYMESTIVSSKNSKNDDIEAQEIQQSLTQQIQQQKASPIVSPQKELIMPPHLKESSPKLSTRKTQAVVVQQKPTSKNSLKMSPVSDTATLQKLQQTGKQQQPTSKKSPSSISPRIQPQQTLQSSIKTMASPSQKSHRSTNQQQQTKTEEKRGQAAKSPTPRMDELMKRSALSNRSSLMLSTTTNGFNQQHQNPKDNNNLLQQRPPAKTNRDTSGNQDDETNMLLGASSSNLSSTMRTAQCPKHHGHHITTKLKSSNTSTSCHRHHNQQHACDRSRSNNTSNKRHQKDSIRNNNYATISPTGSNHNKSLLKQMQSPIHIVPQEKQQTQNEQQSHNQQQYQTLTNEPSGEDMTLLLGCSNGMLTASQLSIGRRTGSVTPRGEEQKQQQYQQNKQRQQPLKRQPQNQPQNTSLSNTLDEYLQTSQFGLNSESSATATNFVEDRPMRRILVDGEHNNEDYDSFASGQLLNSSQGNLTNSFGAKKQKTSTEVDQQLSNGSRTLKNRSRPRII